MNRRVWGWWALMLGIAVLLGGAALLYRGVSVLPVREALRVPCNDVVSGCGLPGQQLRVRFDRHPQPMRPFLITVEIPDAHEVHASFTMRDMQMGQNRFRLLPASAGTWAGDITLPVCISGRSDWEMVLDIDGRLYQMPFVAG